MSLEWSVSQMKIAEQEKESGENNLEALQRAVERGDVEVARRALAQEGRAPDCPSLLRSAVIRCDVPMVRLLLAQRPELNPATGSGVLSPLWIAVLYEFAEVAELLVRSGADVNERLGPHSIHDCRSSFLHVLAASGNCWGRNERLVALLVRQGADVDALDSKGQSVLHYAVTLGRLELAGSLLRSGARVNVANQQGESVLHAAAQGSSAEQLVPMLLSRGAEAGARDRTGMNALHYLARAGKEHLGAARLLLEHGASLHEIEEINEYAPLHFAAMKGKENLAKLFFEYGADINAKSNSGVFPLYLGAKFYKPTMIRLLLKLGANIHERTKKGRTAMHSACSNVLEKNIRVLLEFGANINLLDDEGNTPFSLIEYKNMNPSITTVLKHLAKLKAQDFSIDVKDFEIIEQYPKLKLFYEECLNEISKMKEKFYNSYSFCSILFKSQNQLASLTRNLDFVIAFKKSNYKQLFPRYAYDLDMIFENAQKRKDLLFTLESQLNSVFFGHLPDIVIIKISYFLSIDHLLFSQL